MLKVLELFGGIGACSKALERLGVDYEIADYVEVDLIMHGSPCQDFSNAGNKMGGDEGSGTRSSLMYETIRIVEKVKPKYVIWENVKNLISKTHIHNFEKYLSRMNDLGYTNYYKILNAKDYGIPQNRERIFTVSILGNEKFEFPEPITLQLKLKDMLEDTVDQKYYISEAMKKYIIADNDKWTGNNGGSFINKTIASTINTGEGSRRCDASNYFCNELPENFNLKIKCNTKRVIWRGILVMVFIHVFQIKGELFNMNLFLH